MCKYKPTKDNFIANVLPLLSYIRISNLNLYGVFGFKSFMWIYVEVLAESIKYVCANEASTLDVSVEFSVVVAFEGVLVVTVVVLTVVDVVEFVVDNTF